MAARWTKIGGNWAIVAEGGRRGKSVSVERLDGTVSSHKLGTQVGRGIWLPGPQWLEPEVPA